MVEDDFRRRENFRRTRRGHTSEKKVPTFHLIEFQIVLCAISIITVLIIRMLGGGVYNSVKDGVSNAFNNGITKSDFAAAFKIIKDNLPTSGVFSSKTTSSSMTSSNASSGVNSGFSSKSSSISSSASSSSSKSVTSSAAS